MSYGLTPVVISATLGSTIPPLPIPADIPSPIGANCRLSSGLRGGTNRGVLSRPAVIERAEPLPLPREMLVDALCELAGRLYRELVEPAALMVLEWDWLCECPRDGEVWWRGGVPPSVPPVDMDRENGTTPARRAMSSSPRCQCIASAARQGTFISAASLDHISRLNLGGLSQLSCMKRGEREAEHLNWMSGRAQEEFIPFIQPRKFIPALLIPIHPPLLIVLIVKAAAGSAPSWKPVRNIIPLHPTASQPDEQRRVLSWPRSEPLRGRLCWVGWHTALPTSSTTGSSRRRWLLPQLCCRDGR